MWSSNGHFGGAHPFRNGSNDQGVKVQYGGTPNADLGAAWIPSSGLLEGNALECPAWNTWSDEEGPGVPGQGRLPFGVANVADARVDADWWSWVFWAVTRMEEYNAPASAFDGMGRFQATASMAHAEGLVVAARGGGPNPGMGTCHRSHTGAFNVQGSSYNRRRQRLCLPAPQRMAHRWCRWKRHRPWTHWPLGRTLACLGARTTRPIRYVRVA